MGGGREKEREKKANRLHKNWPKKCICSAEGAYGKNTTFYRRKSLFLEFYVQPTSSIQLMD